MSLYHFLRFSATSWRNAVSAPGTHAAVVMRQSAWPRLMSPFSIALATALAICRRSFLPSGAFSVSRLAEYRIAGGIGRHPEFPDAPVKITETTSRD